jgi:ketosteroid isomerase-like protein
MRKLILCLLPLAALAAGPAAAANPEDEALNSVYRGLVESRSRSDVAGMAAAFGSEALLIDQRPMPAISGAELADRLRPMAARIVADNVRIDTAYRVERRSVSGDLAIDAGYMRQSLARPGAEPMVRYSRFLVTMRRGESGAWRIVADASMPSTEEAWDSVARSEGLLHGG